MIQQNNAMQYSSSPMFQPPGKAALQTGMIILQPFYGLPNNGVKIFVDGIEAGALTNSQGLKIKVRAGDHQIGMQPFCYNNLSKPTYADLQVDPGVEYIFAVGPVVDDYMLIAEPSLLGDPSLFQSKRVSAFSPSGNLIFRRYYMNGSTKITYFDWGNQSFTTSLRCVFSNDLTSLNIYLDRSLRCLLYTCERERGNYMAPLQAVGNFKLTRYTGETIGYIHYLDKVNYIIKPDRATRIGSIFLTQIEKNLLHNRDFALRYLSTGQPVAYVQWQTNALTDFRSFSINSIQPEDEELMTLAFVTFTMTFFAENAQADFAPKV